MTSRKEIQLERLRYAQKNDEQINGPVQQNGVIARENGVFYPLAFAHSGRQPAQGFFELHSGKSY